MTNLIVSLEDVSLSMAEEIAEHLSDKVWGFKIHTIYSQYGVEAVKRLKHYGHIFVDRKLWDIPTTVVKEIGILEDCGASMVTVHCHASTDMLHMAKRAAENCKVIGVTYMSDFVPPHIDAGTQLGDLVRKAHGTNLDGIVANPFWINGYETYNLPIITAGIRPTWYPDKGDHTTPLTPSKAVELGSSYLVLGRCLFGKDGHTPREKVELIHEELQSQAAA